MAGNSRDSKILAYKDMVNQLNKTISAQTERIQSLQKTLEADPTWEQELPDDITVPEHKRKARRTHANLFKNVPSCDEVISLPEEERNCPACGTQMECIGKEFVRYEFRFTPARGKVVNIYRETYKFQGCPIKPGYAC